MSSRKACRRLPRPAGRLSTEGEARLALRGSACRVLGEQREPLRLAEVRPGLHVLVGLDGDVAEVAAHALDLADVDVLVG